MAYNIPPHIYSKAYSVTIFVFYIILHVTLFKFTGKKFSSNFFCDLDSQIRCNLPPPKKKQQLFNISLREFTFTF